MSNSEWLVAGLGNPGKKYEKTRHNIGWMVVDSLSQKFHKEYISRMYYDFFELELHESRAVICKPTTYMNNSGEAVKRLMDKHNITPDNIIIISDEYNFPLGKIHMKIGGSDGGHNGVASVIDKIDTAEFIRLRCGIGNDFEPGGLVDYVLSDFPQTQSRDVLSMIIKAMDSVEYLMDYGLERTMQEVNSGFLWTPRPKSSENTGIPAERAGQNPEL